jgi:TPP-dependent 2-oxoacid decarboxylase
MSTEPYKNVLLRLNPEMQDKLQEIQKEMGMEQTSDTLRYCISFTLKKLVPEYVRNITATPEQKAKHKTATKKAKERLTQDQERERLEKIMNELDVKLLDNGMCEYKTYTYVNANNLPFVGSRKINVSELTEQHVKDQYKGATKEEILKALDNNQTNE